MTGGFGVQRARRALDDVEQTGVFRRVVDVPLSPFRALAGAGDTPGAVREFNLIAREFVRTAELLPERLRWQIELLLYDVEERQVIETALSTDGRIGVQWRPKVAEAEVDQSLTAQSTAVLDVQEDGLRLSWQVALQFMVKTSPKFK